MANAVSSPWHRFGGRKGRAAVAAHAGAQQARRSVRGQIPHHRFRAQQPGELGDLLDLRADAVQEPVAVAASCAMPGSSPTCSRTSSSFRCPRRCARANTGIEGTSDAIFQNIHLIELSNPDVVAVFGADHIYRMDMRQMLAYHRDQGAKGTVAALPIPISEAKHFGTMEVEADWRIVRFYEKVSDPPEIPGAPRLDAGFDGQLPVRQRRAGVGVAPRRHAPRQRPRFRQEHASRNGQ